MNKVFALVDCNNFYASCERLFRPELKEKPIVVLSNNDGCIVARSNEAKALGIPMAAPYFKSKEIIRLHNVQVFSSNYALYGDLSHRVMNVLREMEPEVEIYSIDEAFISLPVGKYQDLTDYARVLKAKVEQWVGIPVSIGIAPTKTLAKIAGGLAKKNAAYGGVFNLSTHKNINDLLSSVEVADVWGIGRRSAEKLHRHGIYNACQLKNGADNWLREQLTVTGLRTAMELRGTSCLALEQARPNKKAILSSRSFGQPTSSLTDLKEAIATHVSIATGKLRQQRSAANAVNVFIYTNRFKKDAPQYTGDITIPLPQASGYTPTMIKHALQGLARIYRPGYQYNKAGVMLTGLVARNRIQQNLFGQEARESMPLMATIDKINLAWGRDTISFAAEGLKKSWRMQQSHRSPAYTTSWADLPAVKASL